MELSFTKLEAAGNDFVVIDATKAPLTLAPTQLRHLADRHFGVGCDQILIVEPATRPDADFFYRIYNADGSESGQCGNGARCFARFIHDQGLSSQPELRLQTRDGLLVAYQQAGGNWRVNLGVPRWEPTAVPLLADLRQTYYHALSTGGETLEFGAVSLGNPHAVMAVVDVALADVAQLGSWLEHHPLFPAKVNVGFMQVIDSQHIHLRVHERGAGETLACGSGACAAVVVGRLWGQLGAEVKVTVRGGELQVSYLGEGAPVWLSGPARTVFYGSIIL
jgi:diaminopimelate epimerase